MKQTENWKYVYKGILLDKKQVFDMNGKLIREDMAENPANPYMDD